jgi:hypothetical protein
MWSHLQLFTRISTSIQLSRLQLCSSWVQVRTRRQRWRDWLRICLLLIPTHKRSNSSSWRWVKEWRKKLKEWSKLVPSEVTGSCCRTAICSSGGWKNSK